MGQNVYLVYGGIMSFRETHQLLAVTSTLAGAEEFVEGQKAEGGWLRQNLRYWIDSVKLDEFREYSLKISDEKLKAGFIMDSNLYPD